MRSSMLFAATAAMIASTTAARADDATSTPTPTRPLFVASAVTLGVSYAPSALVGLAGVVGFFADPPIFCGVPRDDGAFAVNLSSRPCPQHGAAWMLVPIAGPLLYARSSERDETFRPHGPPETSERAILYTTSALQGAALLGLAIDAATRRPESKTAFVATPMPGGGAMSVGGSF